jgi:hypothetical protein
MATTATWYWFNSDKFTFGDPDGWTKLSETDTESIEGEYREHIRGARYGQRIFHCFGGGLTTSVDFDSMQTFCCSGRCRCNVRDQYMVYKLKRIGD